ncbi:MAG: tetratricopeptide repeat protein, partial [Planctomycetaceae bacterium]
MSLAARSEAQTRPGDSATTPLNEQHEKTKIEAQTAHQEGRHERAIELVNTVLRENRQDDVAWYLRGSARIQSAAARRDAALLRKGINDIREAIRLGGSKRPIYYLPYLFGMTRLSQLEDRDAHATMALPVADKLLANASLTDEEKSHVHYQRGLLHQRLGEFDAAIADMQQAIQLNDLHLGARLALADLHAAQGRTQEAKAAFDQAAETFANSPLVWNNRGMFLQHIGQAQAAIADFTAAIAVDANYFVAYTNRGSVHLAVGGLDAAEADLTKSLALNPNQPTAYRLRGTVRLNRGEIEQAVADYSQALRLEPQNAAAHADLGFARLFAGDHRAALTEFDRAVVL